MSAKPAAAQRDEALNRLVAKMSDPAEWEEFRKSLKTPIDLIPRSGDWICAREARLFVSEHAKITFPEAEQTLCRRALQWVPLRVESFGRREDPHDYIDRIEFFDGKELDTSHFAESPLPTAWSEIRSFFTDIAGHIPILAPLGVSYADWACGDFKVTIDRDFSDVTIEITGLQFDRRALAQSIGVTLNGTSAGRTARMTDQETREWIETCDTENSKEAWRQLRKLFGSASPKKLEQFEPLWREMKGGRGRGRPRNAAIKKIPAR